MLVSQCLLPQPKPKPVATDACLPALRRAAQGCPRLYKCTWRVQTSSAARFFLSKALSEVAMVPVGFPSLGATSASTFRVPSSDVARLQALAALLSEETLPCMLA
jgi:hypothetical protein